MLSAIRDPADPTPIKYITVDLNRFGHADVTSKMVTTDEFLEPAQVTKVKESVTCDLEICHVDAIVVCTIVPTPGGLCGKDGISAFDSKRLDYPRVT